MSLKTVMGPGPHQDRFPPRLAVPALRHRALAHLNFNINLMVLGDCRAFHPAAGVGLRVLQLELLDRLPLTEVVHRAADQQQDLPAGRPHPVLMLPGKVLTYRCGTFGSDGGRQ